MWISDYITRNSFQSSQPSCGEITASEQKGLAVSSSNSYFNLPRVSPYGIAWVPVEGARTVVLPTEDGGVSLGVLGYGNPPQGVSLSPGELMLYSSGGASIVLKNDGSVLINGKAVS